MVIKRNAPIELISDTLSPSSAGRVFIQTGMGHPYPEIIDYGDFAGSATWRRLGRSTKLPVGGGVIPAVVSTSVGVPKMVPVVTPAPKAPLPPPIDRRDATPPTTSVQMSDDGYERGYVWEKTANGRWTLIWPDGRRTESLTDEGAAQMSKELGIPEPYYTTTTPTTTTDSEAPMDLGQLITDLGTTYIQTRYAPQPTATVPTVQPALDPFGIGGDIIDYFTAPDGTVVPVKKKKKCRRRRRRLATKSDLGDLAALKAILGNGEAFKAWIATHSR